jgi:DsbC/DsbD-like thiol-disulfide interchange protein
MNAVPVRPNVLTAVLCSALTCVSAAHAADASSWDGDARAAVRLIGDGTSGTTRAGVEMRLAPGWKTYWRYPGDSGVPPVFDFAKSENVKSVTVLWPAPHRFKDDSGNSIGYKGGVVFPLRIVARDPRQPVRLRLALDYAVCEKLCVPARGVAQLDLGSRQSTFAARLANTSSAEQGPLAAAEASVPAPARLGDTAPLAIRALRREAGGAHPRIVVDVAAPDGTPLDLFVEGPEPNWALPLPEPVAAPQGLHRFAFELDGLPPGASADGAQLRLTLIAGTQAIDVTAPLPDR